MGNVFYFYISCNRTNLHMDEFSKQFSACDNYRIFNTSFVCTLPRILPLVQSNKGAIILAFL